MALRDTHARCHPERRARYYEKETRRPICNSCYHKRHYIENRQVYSRWHKDYYANPEIREIKKERSRVWHWNNRDRSLRKMRFNHMRRKINGHVGREIA